MAEKKEKKLVVCCPDLKKSTREEKNGFIEVLNHHIELIEAEIKNDTE